MQPPPPSPNVATKPRGAEGASFGIFLALLAGLAVFSRASTPLLRYPDRAIGVGLMGGVDPARRFPIYLELVAAVLGVWLACHYGTRLLQRKQPTWFLGVRSRLENDLCALFAAVGSVAVVARVSADRLDRLGPTLMCLVALGTVLVFALARRLRPRLSWLPRQLGSPSTLALVVLLAWPASQIAGVLGNVQGADGAWMVLVGTFLLPLAYGSALAFFLRHPGRATRADLLRAFALGAAPLFAFPSACPVANEVQYALARRHAIEPRSVALGFLLLLVILGGVLFWRARAGKLRLPTGRLLARYVYPTIIFGEALLSVYKHVLTTKHVDPLHDGEQITAVQQLLSFDKWPFVDIWPAHGLFDYVGALYSLVNGFHPLEITAWNCLLSALSATAVYAILANIGTPLFAFAVAALLPIEAILPLPKYSFFYAEPGLLAVGLVACQVLARPSTWRYALLSLGTFLCFFWTPTSGVAAIVAVFGLLVLGLLTTEQRRPVWRGLAVFVGTGAAVFALYVLVLALRGQPVLETLRLVRAFMQADPLIGGRTTVLEQFDAPAFVQYLILPGIGLVYLGRLARHAIERRPLTHVERLLGFLTLVSFVLFARTLTRHGIIERYQPFYFVLLALCAGMPRRGVPAAPLGAAEVGDARASELAAHFWQRASARAWFCLGLALYLVWLPHRSHKHLVFDPFEFHTWQAKESRFQGDAPEYPALSPFLRGALGPKDTFLELLNMPVMYGLLDREVPGQFFLPTMFYATDSVQDSYLRRLEAFGGSARVPVVLLPGAKGKGNIDKIENTLRSYRIAEHIYREYVPFGSMDNLAVWVSRARWGEAARKKTPLPLSFRDPSKYRLHSVDPPRLEGGVLAMTATGSDPRVEDVAEVDGITLGGIDSYHAVRLSYRTSVAGELELFYRYARSKYGAANSGRATLATSPSGEWQSAEIAIPGSDPALALTALRVDPPDGAQLEIKDLTLVFGQAPALDSDRDVIGMLPFFWGNFDDRHAAQNAAVLQSIDVPAGNPPLASFNLALQPTVDKTSGNYLKLCIRLPGLGAPAKTSRWRTVNHVDSWQSAGKVTLSYGGAPSGTFVFDLVKPLPGAPGIPKELARSFAEECKPYLVRLSAQYVWSSVAVSSISVSSTVPIVLESASVLAGD